VTVKKPDDQDLRKWALSQSLLRASSAEHACREAEILVKYVQTGETRKPVLAEIIPR